MRYIKKMYLVPVQDMANPPKQHGEGGGVGGGKSGGVMANAAAAPNQSQPQPTIQSGSGVGGGGDNWRPGPDGKWSYDNGDFGGNYVMTHQRGGGRGVDWKKVMNPPVGTVPNMQYGGGAAMNPKGGPDTNRLLNLIAIEQLEKATPFTMDLLRLQKHTSNLLRATKLNPTLRRRKLDAALRDFHSTLRMR